MRHYQPALDFEPWLSTGFGATIRDAVQVGWYRDTLFLGLDTEKYGTQKHMDFDLYILKLTLSESFFLMSLKEMLASIHKLAANQYPKAHWCSMIFHVHSPVLDGPAGSTSQSSAHFWQRDWVCAWTPTRRTNIDIIITLSMPSMPAPQQLIAQQLSPQICVELGSRGHHGLIRWVSRYPCVTSASNVPMYGCERRAFPKCKGLSQFSPLQWIWGVVWACHIRHLCKVWDSANFSNKKMGVGLQRFSGACTTANWFLQPTVLLAQWKHVNKDNMGGCNPRTYKAPYDMGMGQSPIPLVNIKIAGKWMFIP